MKFVSVSTLILIMTFTFHSISVAQKVNRTFKGNIIDSATTKPIADATISIYKAKDTSMINFAFSTPNGNYDLSAHLRDSLLVIISYLGYKEKIFRIPQITNDWSFNMENIKLQNIGANLKEVVISYATIRMNKDTIEIDANKIKVLPGSDVASLFKKIPGFEVDRNGNIKVNGSSISKITVDGSDFFGNNPSLISKNLKADMISSVQVYDDKDEVGTTSKENTKSINLKLKPNKRNGYFGDALAGYGSQDKYELGMRVNNFKNDQKFSIIANANNINDEGFDFGFSNMHSASNASRNGALSNFIMYYVNNEELEKGNLNKGAEVAATYYNEFKNKKKFSCTANAYNNVSNSIFFNTSTNPYNLNLLQTSKNNKTDNGNILSGNVSTTFSQKIDSTISYSIGLKANSKNNDYTVKESNTVLLQDSIINSITANKLQNVAAKNITVTTGIDFYQRKNIKNFISFKFNCNFERDQNNVFQNGISRNQLLNFNLLNNLNKNEYLFKILALKYLTEKFNVYVNADVYSLVAHNSTKTYTADNVNVFNTEQNYSKKIDTLSIQFLNKAFQKSAKFGANYSFTKQSGLSLAITLLDINMYNKTETNNLTYNQNHLKLLPSFTYYKWDRMKGNFYIYLTKSIDFPDYNDLMPFINISNPAIKNRGNPYLMPVEQYSLSINAGLRNRGNFTYIWTGLRLNQSDNYRCFVKTISPNGVTYITPQNLTGYNSASANASVNYKINDIFSVELDASLDYKHIPEINNLVTSFGNMKNINLSPSFNIEVDEIFEIDIDYNAYYTKYNNSKNSLGKYQQWLNGVNVDMDYTIKKTGTEISFENDISDKRAIPVFGKIVVLSNAEIIQNISKNKKWKIKLTAHDIFNQNQNISRLVDGNYITISQSNNLRRFVLATLIYKLEGNNDGSNFVW